GVPGTPNGTAAGVAEVPDTAQPSGGAVAEGTESPASSEDSAAGTQPPAWDPLGAAPFAWDLPEPGAPSISSRQAPEPRRNRPRTGLTGLATAIVTAGICFAVAPLTGGWMTPAHGLAIVLAVVGLSLVKGAVTRSGRGLIPLAVLLGIAALLANAAGSGSWGWYGADNARYAPSAFTAVQPHYRSTLGNITLDLSGLPGAGSASTRIDDTAGNVNVTVPDNADVHLRCASRFGNLDCLGHSTNRINPHQQFTDNGFDGQGGPSITLDVHTVAGNVEVDRG
ncbi:MAG: LiaF domain-containing protein, partial [Sciscionella sp.]